MPEVRLAESVLHALGFWRSEEIGYGLFRDPHPRELVDLSWDEEERERVVRYLRSGISLRGYFGPAHCRFTNDPDNFEMGTDDLTDGQFIWPQGLAIYVERYCVGLPEVFVQKANQLEVVQPLTTTLEILRKYDYSSRFWHNWVRKNRSNRLLALLSVLIPL